jgi:hypothetical protein
MTTVISIKTRLTRDSEPIKTELIVNWDGVTDDQLKQLAISTVVIRYQAIVRAAGKIPSSDTLNVPDLFVPRARTPATMTPDKVLAKAKADPAFMAALQELLASQH